MSSIRKRKRAVGRWRVFLNDADMSHHAFYADDRRGVVRMFYPVAGVAASGGSVRLPVPEHGRRLFNGFDGALTCELHGKVRLVRV